MKLWHAGELAPEDEQLARFFHDQPAPSPAPPAPPATVDPVMPRTYHEVLRAVQLRVIEPEEARYYLGLPRRRSRWWPW